MNVFEYFADEQESMDKQLAELTANYEVWSREKVFDSVKAICDAITGHLKKQSLLLLSKLEGISKFQSLLEEARKDREKVQEEIGQLVEVHVDEPGYEEYLRNLLVVLREHIAFSKRLYQDIQKNASQPELATLDQEFNNIVLHSTEFNYLQAT